MEKALEVFEITGVNVEQVQKIVESKIDKSLIKERKQGSTNLKYIGGHTVIKLLNTAFGYAWSFEIVKEEIIQSLPKPVWTGYGNNRKPVLNQDGTQKMEPQAPVVKILGRLTIPGYGVKEQYGSKVLIGGATEQESAFKSASTDALKKCASLFGVGLELYMDDEEREYHQSNVEQPQYVQPQEPVQQQAPQEQPPVEEKKSYTPPKQEQPQQQATQANPNEWQQEDIVRLKELKAILGITNNNDLNPFIQEFLDSPNVTFEHITPSNVKAVNIFLTKKAESL